MTLISVRNIDQYLQKRGIQTRPNAGHGLWLMFLLPLAIIISNVSHPIICTSTYKLSSIFSVGLICSSVVFLSYTTQTKIAILWQALACSIVVVLLQICLHRGILFSVWSAIFSTFFYKKLYFTVLTKMRHSFTLGEAAIFTQSYVLLIYNTLLNVCDKITKPAANVMQMSTITIQVGLCGLSLIFLLVYKWKVTSPGKFYTVTVLVLLVSVVFPLQIFINKNPLLWILYLFWEDINQNRVILYWIFFTFLAVVTINQRVQKAQKATTAVRKVFHFLVVAVFIPGLICNCSLLYLASGVTLGIFFMLEVLRILNVPPLAQSLQNGLVIFGDEKDVGIIALTPMYLLAGCSLPIWLHPAPCDVTNSAVFNLLPLLSGVLTIGVGDMAASVVGSKIGRHHWSGSKKSVEGTVACVASQVLAVSVLVYLNFVKLSSPGDYIKTTVGVLITSLVEAKTDQVDNLVLPFIMYLILIW